MTLDKLLQRQMIKYLALGTVGLASIFFLNAQKAESRECSQGDGFMVCYEFLGRYNDYNSWELQFFNAHTSEEMDLVCDDKEVHTWSSEGGLSQNEAEYLAEYFCAL